MPVPIASYKIPELNIAVEVFSAPNGNLCGSVSIQRDNEAREDSPDVLAGEEGDISAYDGAIDGIETLLLALACEGFDLREEKMKRAIQIALDSLSNHH